jgi:hypothetical protein
MKEKTLRRLNKTVFGYLSLVGLSGKDKMLINDNPVFNYFTNLIFQSDKSKELMKLMTSGIPTTGDGNDMGNMPNIHDELMNMDSLPNIKISNESFHLMIKEIFKIYDDIDDIKTNQNSEIKEILMNFVGSENNYDNYIDEITENFKESFYKLIRYYNSSNEGYLNIKIKILNDKMMEYVEIEDYLEAAELQRKIAEIKNKLNQ